MKDHVDSYEARGTAGAVEALFAEIERYLDAVAVFRALGSEPTWRPERASDVVTRIRACLGPHELNVSGP